MSLHLVMEKQLSLTMKISSVKTFKDVTLKFHNFVTIYDELGSVAVCVGLGSDAFDDILEFVAF